MLRKSVTWPRARNVTKKRDVAERLHVTKKRDVAERSHVTRKRDRVAERSHVTKKRRCGRSVPSARNAAVLPRPRRGEVTSPRRLNGKRGGSCSSSSACFLTCACFLISVCFHTSACLLRSACFLKSACFLIRASFLNSVCFPSSACFRGARVLRKSEASLHPPLFVTREYQEHFCRPRGMQKSG